MDKNFGIREQNESKVIACVINNLQISRAEIAKEIEVNKVTISEIVKKLLEKKVLLDIGEGESKSSGGRPPILLEFNYHIGMIIAIELALNEIRYTLSYLNGFVIKKSTISIKINKDNILDQLLSIIDTLHKVKNDSVLGIIGTTIAIYGAVDDNKIIFTPYYDIDKVSLYDQLKDRYKFPIYLENEANLISLSELYHSETSEYENIASLSVHNGIGLGLLINKNLYKGKNGMSGEVGHTILYPLGRACPCGNRGCFEQYCSNFAIISEYRKLAKNSELTILDLVDDYKNGVFEAKQIVEDFCFNISIGINNIIMTYSPDVIFISSLLTHEIPFLLAMISDHMTSNFSENIEINNSNVFYDGVLDGAFVLSLKRFVNYGFLRFL